MSDPKITQETIDAILVLVLQEKMSANQVGKALGIHRDTVRHILYSHGYHKVGGRWVPDSKAS